MTSNVRDARPQGGRRCLIHSGNRKEPRSLLSQASCRLFFNLVSTALSGSLAHHQHPVELSYVETQRFEGWLFRSTKQLTKLRREVSPAAHKSVHMPVLYKSIHMPVLSCSLPANPCRSRRSKRENIPENLGLMESGLPWRPLSGPCSIPSQSPTWPFHQ